MAKKHKNAHEQIEKLLAVAGLALVVLGCVASLYGAYVNQDFIHDFFPSPIYYFRHIIILGGGLAAGYLLTRKGKEKYARLLSGVGYAFLAMALYHFFDVVRLLAQSAFGTPSYPWGMLVFESSPLFAVVAAALVAYLVQYRAKRTAFGSGAQLLFVASFIISQVYYLLSTLYALVTVPGAYDPRLTPLWLVVGSYLINPLFIAAVTFAALHRTKDTFRRLFYSVFIGAITFYFTLVLSNFSTDPSLDSVTAFQIFIMALTLLVTVALLWKARRAES